MRIIGNSTISCPDQTCTAQRKVLCRAPRAGRLKKNKKNAHSTRALVVSSTAITFRDRRSQLGPIAQVAGGIRDSEVARQCCCCRRCHSPAEAHRNELLVVILTYRLSYTCGFLSSSARVVLLQVTGDNAPLQEYEVPSDALLARSLIDMGDCTLFLLIVNIMYHCNNDASTHQAFNSGQSP